VSYRIRRFEPADREGLRRLIYEVWPDRPPEVFDKRWWWRTESPPLFVAEDEASGAIVGVCAFPAFPLYFDNRTVNATWFVDFFVSDKHQGKGIGKALSLAVMKEFAVTASLSQTEAAWQTFKRLGWQERQTTKLYLNPWGLLPGANALLRAIAPVDRGLRLESGEFVILPALASAHDALWQALRSRYQALSVRDAQTLATRYARRDDRHYEIVRAWRGERLCGYMIIRVCPPNSLRSLKRYPVGRRPIGLVVDYLAAPDEPLVFASLLDAAAELLEARGARSMLCLCSVDAFHPHLTRRGFLHGGTPLLRQKLATMDVSFTAHFQPNETVLIGRRWFLTLGDCDMDLTWGESPV